MDKVLKEKIINNIFKGIDKIIETEYKHHPNERPYSCCRIQEGYNDYLKITFKKGQIKYYRCDFDWNTNPDLKIVCEELKEVKRDDFVKEILPEIKSKFEEIFFKYKDSFLFRYKFLLILEFEGEEGLLKDRTYSEKFYIENKERKEELKSKMEDYIKEVIFEEKKAIKDDRECVVFIGNLFDFNLMEYSESDLIELIEKILQVMKSVKNRKLEKEIQHDILYHLGEWTDDIFLKLEPKKVTEEQIDLYIYKALFQIKYGTYSYDTKYGCEDLKNAMNKYNSQKAKQYLEKGTGALPDELIYYKDENLECKANDVLAIIDIKIKNEIAKSYEKALDFIINLLTNGFPHSYLIKFSSKSEKEFLNIKGLAKSSTHRFFRRILDFPELYDKLESYAKVAMKEFEWYQDVEEGEKSLLPGSYAIFGLGLHDEKYFPLIEEYYSKLDNEHQLAHQYFIETLIDKYGVTKKSLHIIFEGFLSGQFDKIFKNLAKLMEDEENKKLLIKELKNYDKYEKEDILYSIWGNKWKKFFKE
ncbi:DUF6138 family protein [Fusobacterium polymorphum]|uniref:Uncharacterized protein n=1 Tax=Fusobacterium nucleatum CTI-6 TaxID=1316587 RepID=U7U005_FUSNU|nr:DUF6138 family protein [Fusobacterium nucleatum]ERT49452.1 hypothetical protein HMPREF1767_00048 [Fusobacterium nucleatum CTI-6]